jgi:hypothetical protein
MTQPQTPSQRITAEVTSWPGVDAGHGRRGEFAFKLGRHEIGHLHGDHAAHFFFPKDVWDRLMHEHRITSHPVFPDKRGPAARAIGDDDDVQDAIALMRLNYDRLLAPREPAAREPAPREPAPASESGRTLAAGAGLEPSSG